VAISVDPPEVSREQCTKAGYTFTVVSDPNAEVIRRYDLRHLGAGLEGHDVARPAEFPLDSSRVVRWVSFTEDARVRARADEMPAQAKKLR